MNGTTTPSLPSADTSESPLSAAALRRLFFSPTEYFRTAPLGQGGAWLIAAWVSGISSVMDRVDQRLMRSDLGAASDSSGNDIGFIVDSWIPFWGFVLAVGLVWAAWNWWVGGWWYRTRLKWSGAEEADPRQARLVYTFGTFVISMPSVTYVIIQSVAYPSYLAAWQADSVWPLILLVFLFWSVVVSWRGVMAIFPIRRGRALWWFALLPVCFYVVILGVVGALFATTG